MIYDPTELLEIENAPKKEPTSTPVGPFTEFVAPSTPAVATGAALNGLVLSTPESLPQKEIFADEDVLLSTPLL